MSMWASQFFSFRCCKKTFKHIGKVLRGPLIQRAKDKLNLDFGLFFLCKTCMYSIPPKAGGSAFTFVTLPKSLPLSTITFIGASFKVSFFTEK